jgi:3-oxoacyl-[acyl-carrier-protein] synthase III
MDGREVYRHAVARMVASSQRVLERAGWEVTDVDRLVAHQANVRILDAVGRSPGGRTRAPARQHPPLRQHLGGLDPARPRRRRAAPGDRVLVTAFGGGLTWGSTVLRGRS